MKARYIEKKKQDMVIRLYVSYNNCAGNKCF